MLFPLFVFLGTIVQTFTSSIHLKIDLIFTIDFPPSFFFLLSFDWQYHPDKQSADVPAGEVEARMQRFIEIDRAWKILGNEETKKEYDLQRRGRFLPRSAVVATAAPAKRHWSSRSVVFFFKCFLFDRNTSFAPIAPSLFRYIIYTDCYTSIRQYKH